MPAKNLATSVIMPSCACVVVTMVAPPAPRAIDPDQRSSYRMQPVLAREEELLEDAFEEPEPVARDGLRPPLEPNLSRSPEDPSTRLPNPWSPWNYLELVNGTRLSVMT